MKVLREYEFWFITGSQHLYGEEVLKQVEANSKIMVEGLAKDGRLPGKLVFKQLVTRPNEIKSAMEAANFDPNCAGVITWCHTFSPSKMWISGLNLLNKPWLHLHTQFNRNIPTEAIDMDFMNLNQAAHGDREHGFIATRLRKPRKVVVGYWENEGVRHKIGDWMRSAIGVSVSRNLNIVRFGDNMRQVAVTEGDKVEAEIKLGWSINTHAVGDLVEVMKTISEEAIDTKLEDYRSKYDFATDRVGQIRYQAHMQLAMEHILAKENAGAYTNTFEDLHGLEQLPGLASQDLMATGYGYGGEGDWKVSALTHIMKAMAQGLGKGTSFMEDYTYDLTEGNELILGSHMLEICPSIAETKPQVKVQPLGIGGKTDPARLTFDGKSGNAIVASLVDMGGRLRIVVNDIECVQPYQMPKLPVAATMWKPKPCLEVSAEAWILAGGAHHSVLSFDLNAQHLRDWAEMMEIEFVHIHEGTTINELKRDLFFADVAWRLR
ncbi:MAG: L-arabinose isomerase [Turicibacter sp.]|nr:L-arabinose isomerase [Turicibacter sp.]